MAVVEVRSPGVTVVLDGRTLRINARRETLGRVALSDIDMLVLEVPSVGVSGAALAALAAAGIPALVCDGQHRPAAWLNPVAVADSFDPDRARRQAGLPERTRARLWRQIVRAKIAAQADMLAEAGFPDGPLRALVEKVAPGDPTNVEATAAQRYWPALFGSGFRRRGDTPITDALDWGYAVLRSLVCRALVIAGLHPSIGLQHRSGGNAFNLADDLIEPYRPVVDRRIRHCFASEDPSMPAWKRRLAELADHPVELDGRTVRLRTAVEMTTVSLVRVLDQGKGTLALPDRILGEADAARLAPDVARRLL